MKVDPITFAVIKSGLDSIRIRAEELGIDVPEDAAAVQEREINLIYDTLENSVSWPGDRTPNVRAQNLNTIDEVPDSTWFTNRLGTVPVTVDELVKGPGSGTGPAALPSKLRNGLPSTESVGGQSTVSSGSSP